MFYSLHFLREDVWDLFAMDIAFIANILNRVQLTKFTKTKGCSAGPMEPEMFPTPNPFRKWVILEGSPPMILITILQ